MKSTPEPIIETRSIETRDGTLVIEMTQAFMDRVRLHFGLGASVVVTDAHLREYVWNAVDNAVKKAEAGLGPQ